jgi:glycosyltransferase involved in cell wall biosynthesis
MRIVVMLSVHNEADILGEVIENLLAQELEIVALDNGSDDGAYEICAGHRDRGDLELERWTPDGIDLDRLTRRLYGLALRRPADWMLWSDGDELLQAADPRRTLRQVIEEADAAGANLIQFDRFDFFMTGSDDPGETSITRRLRHYSWQGDFNYRAWRYTPGIAAAPSLAHMPLFPPAQRYRIHPEKQVLRHYPYRSPAQARAKLATLVGKFPADPADLLPWQRRYARLWAEGECERPVAAHRLTEYRDGGPWCRDPLHAPFVDRQPTRSELFTPSGELAVDIPGGAALDPD